MIIFKSIQYKNFLSSGNKMTEIHLNRVPTTLVVGENGAGKCLRGSTEIDIIFDDPEVEKKFLEENVKK